jgi:hypothetical protein
MSHQPGDEVHVRDCRYRLVSRRDDGGWEAVNLTTGWKATFVHDDVADADRDMYGNPWRGSRYER